MYQNGGEIYLDTGTGNMQNVKWLADQNCQRRGLGRGLVESNPTYRGSNGVNHYIYQCVQQSIDSISVSSQQPQNTTEINLSPAKAKCAELGFKTGTEAFGNCVLKISK